METVPSSIGLTQAHTLAPPLSVMKETATGGAQPHGAAAESSGHRGSTRLGRAFVGGKMENCGSWEQKEAQRAPVTWSPG